MSAHQLLRRIFLLQHHKNQRRQFFLMLRIGAQQGDGIVLVLRLGRSVGTFGAYEGGHCDENMRQRSAADNNLTWFICRHKKWR